MPACRTALASTSGSCRFSLFLRKEDELKPLVNRFLKYAAFSGRASRTEYWRFVIVAALVGLLVGWLDNAWIHVQVGRYGLLESVILLFMVVPGWAITVRRLHDFGLSGWWAWLGLVSYLGMFVFLVLLGYAGDAEPNKYGGPSHQTGEA